MNKYLFIILLLNYYELKCQPVVTDASNKRIIEWDTSYQIETIRFFGLREYAPVDYQYIIRKNLKTVAEYFRHDDSSFLFVRIDSLGRQSQKGILKLNFKFFTYDSVQVPDLIKDPSYEKGFFKDTIVANVNYRKEGKWKEVDSSGKLWLGEYVDGKREGIWQCGFYFYDPHMPAICAESMFDNFRPLSKHLFENGKEIVQFADTSFWPIIKGKWFVTLNSNDSNIYIFQRQQIGKIYMAFETSSSFSSIRRLQKSTMHSLEKYTADWKQNGDLLEIIENGYSKIFRVLSITKDRMILRIVKWEN